MFKQNPIIMIGRNLWHYAKGRHGTLLLYYLLEIVTNLTDLLPPYLIGKIINILQVDGKAGVDKALIFVAIFACVEFSSLGLNQTSNWLQMWFNHKIRHAITKDLYGKVQSLPLLWHQEHHSGDVLSRLYNTTAATASFIYLPSQFIRVFITLLGPAVVLLGLSPVIGTSALVMTIVTIIITVYFDKQVKIISKKSNDLSHALRAVVTDYISNIRTILTLRLGLQTVADVDQRMTQSDTFYRVETHTRVKRNLVTSAGIQAIAFSAMAFAIYAFGKPSASFLVGDLIMIINYLQLMGRSVRAAVYLLEDYNQKMVDYEGFDFITDAYNQHEKEHKTKQLALRHWTQITVKNLSFHYAQKPLAALEDLSFTLQRGQKIALVGASGGGKSTLMTVLRGLYPAQSGTAMIDDTAFDAIAPLSAISTLIPQDPEIFENTIRYNITLGVDHTDAEILDACRIACFDTVLDTLPQGLDSKINEKGVNLSGGQKQRLALARGIFAIRASSLVLFDEPTSSVDAVTERRMYGNLFAAFPDICLISSIHRLNLLNQFDTIWVMEHGRLVQQGTLVELIAQTGKPFHTLWSAHQHAQEE